MYQIIIVPEGSVLPEDLRHLLVKESDFLKRLTAGVDSEVLITVSTRELQLLVEYNDLLAIKMRAIIGLQGAMYSTVWNTYVSTMDRVSVDAFRAEQGERNDERSERGRISVIAPTRVDRMARVVRTSAPEQRDDQPSADDFADDASA